MFDDGTEMEWVSRWLDFFGASDDGVLFNTDKYAGTWKNYPITNTMRYICERN